MFTTTTSSKSAVRFTIDFFKKTITGTKASFDKSGKGFGAEYEELTAKMGAKSLSVMAAETADAQTKKAS